MHIWYGGGWKAVKGTNQRLVPMVMQISSCVTEVRALIYFMISQYLGFLMYHRNCIFNGNPPAMNRKSFKYGGWYDRAEIELGRKRYLKRERQLELSNPSRSITFQNK